jgi:hypothetical protein
MKRDHKQETQKLKRHAGIQPYQLRLELTQVGGEYKALCSWHDDHTPSLTIFKKDDEWFFKCFAGSCNENKGDVIRFVQKMDNLTFTEAQQKIAQECGFGGFSSESESESEGSTESANTSHLRTQIKYDRKAGTARLKKDKEAQEYLASRGITLEAALDAGLGVFDFPSLGKCLAIPYSDSNEDVNFRTLDPDKADAKTDKFRSFGKPNSKLYGVENIKKNFFFARRLLIVESELDCVMAQARLEDEYAVVSVSSATGSLNRGELNIVQEHLDAVKNFNGHVFIATDQDRAGDENAAAWMKLLPPYKVSRLTWTGAKDVGELFVKFQDGFKAEIDRLCEESRIPLFWRKPASMDALPYKRLKWIVPDLVPEGEITLMTGDFGSCKSYLSYFIADSVSTGGKFIDRRCEKHPVLILDRENSHATVSLRRSLVGNLRKSKDVHIMCLFTDPPAPDLTHPELLQVCGKIKPLIIIDSLTDFRTGREENNADDMTEFFQEVRALIQAGAAGVLILHHVPKTGKDNARKYRGSTAITAAVGNALFVKKYELNGKPYVSLTGFKSRDGADQEIELKMNFGLEAVTYEVVSSGLDPEFELRRRIEKYLADNPGTTIENIASELDIRKQDVGESLAAMEKIGVVVRLAPGPKGGRGGGWRLNTSNKLQILSREDTA